MREESHLDDMRAAIRGDFERLQERRGEQQLMRVEEPEPDSVVEPESEPEPAPANEQAPETDSSEDALPEPAPAAEPEPAAEAAQRAPTPVRRSWLDRMLGR